MHTQTNSAAMFFFGKGNKTVKLPIIDCSDTELFTIDDASAHTLPIDEILTEMDKHSPRLDIQNRDSMTLTSPDDGWVLMQQYSTNNIIKSPYSTTTQQYTYTPSQYTKSQNSANIDKDIEQSIAIQKEIDFMFSKTTIDELGIDITDNSVSKDETELISEEEGWWVGDDYYNGSLDFEYDPSFIYTGVDI